MNDRTKNVPIGASEYQLRRVTPAVGGYLWHRLMWACNKAAQAAHQGGEAAEGAEQASDLTPEQRLRTICAIGFMQMDLADYEKAQMETLKATSRVDAGGLPMPLMAGDGRWTPGTEDVQTDPFLVTQIMTESLVFNLAPYLAGNSPTPAKS